ncbi:MAG: glycoside hydrolase family 5 protein [Treponema sp.]|nr:glycoside hydrolase family 5 protein [Treponema sp.]
MSKSVKKIRVQNQNFIDEKGQLIIPAGVNMVCKDKTKNYLGGYTDQDFKMLKSLGMNLVRLGIFWDGVEPEPGKYNETYLKAIDSIIKLADQNDICVFLDMHQDLYSASFEDGAPAWATITNGHQYVKTELWSDAYLMSPAVQTAFDNFWNNSPAPDGIGLQEHYETMWKMLAARYASFQNVIGYDVLNEPFPGSDANKVVEALFGSILQLLPQEMLAQASSPEELQALLMDAFSNSEKKATLFQTIGTPENLFKIVSAIEPITAAFEEQKLNPFYKKLGKAIWSVDSNAILMLENNYFSNAGIPSHVKPVKTTDGQIYPNQVYAPHGYDIFVDTDMYDTSDFTRIDLIFQTHKQVAKDLKLPVIIGEWGCYPQALPSQIKQAEHLLSIFQSLKAGNTYYEFQHLKNPQLAECLRKKQ